MQPSERQAQVLAQLHALQSELTVEELAKRFGISSLSIRRDLEQLEADQLILHRWGTGWQTGSRTLREARHRRCAAVTGRRVSFRFNGRSSSGHNWRGEGGGIELTLL